MRYPSWRSSRSPRRQRKAFRKLSKFMRMYISELSFQKETCSRCWLGYVGISRVKRVLKASSRRSFKTRPPLIIHCAAHRHIDALTFKHGESLEDLETAIKSASWESWEHAFQLNVLAPYFSTAGFTKPI